MNVEAGLREACRVKGWERDFYFPDEPDAHPIDEILQEIDEYDAIFHVAFNESLDLPEQIARLALLKGKPVIQWDCDSSWRFQNWILPRKDRVSHFVTTHSATIPWYEQNGLKVIKSQWGGSPLYKRDPDAEKIYDVSFVGQKHGIRPQILDALYKAGVKVNLFGNYWDGYPDWHGYLPNYEDVIRIFNQTKINLNLSNPWHIGTMPQIKGRHFEIPQCGGFQLTTPADDLGSYFDNNKEIIIVNTIEDLIDATKFYLANENKRDNIANAGHARMLRDHSWRNRFNEILHSLSIS